MHKNTRRQVLALTALAALSTLATPTFAQSYPDRPVRLVVGYAPGTAPDVLARLFALRLSEQIKQQVVVDNKPGAGGQIAAQTVAKAVPDGYTLLLGEVGSIAIAPAAFSRLSYDPAKELVGISEIARVDFLLVVPANSPYQTLADFVNANRGKKERVNFGTFGAGTSGHFGAELFGEAAGFKVEPVHYRATGDAVTAIIAGDVAGVFASTALGVAQIKGGKMRALGTTAPQRSPLLPQVPTFAESGYPKIDISSWFAVMAPQGTPAPIAELLSRESISAAQSAETKTKLIEAGFSVLGTTRSDTDQMLRAETTRWAGIVKTSGFKGD
jgi:tripartite-type tricarboxylate transporter receptor subunit TctC